MTIVQSDLKTNVQNKNVLNVLYIEDDHDDLYLIECALNDDQLKHYSLFHAVNFFQAQHALREYHFDVVLLDLSVGRLSGLKTLQQAINILDLNKKSIPIIILTGSEDESMGEKAIQYGAADYLPKKHASTFNLSRSIRFTIERHCLMEKILNQAKIDELTGLLNRRETLQRCQQVIEHSRRFETPIAMAMIDLDGFKPINDEFGHAVGDDVLKAIGHRLSENTRTTDIIGRLGGDEFLIVLTHFESNESLLGVLSKLKSAIETPLEIQLELESKVFDIRCSMGIALFENTLTLKKTLARADQAMYVSKKEKNSEIVFYTEDMEQSTIYSSNP